MNTLQNAYCTNCGNQVGDITKTCNTCGYHANSMLIHCYSCGRKNEEEYLTCAGCKTPLLATQREIVAVLLSFFIFFPFLALYCGRKKEALIRIGVFAVAAICMSIGISMKSDNAVVGTLGGLCWAFLGIWSAVDILRVLFRWPRAYTTGKGLRISR